MIRRRHGLPAALATALLAAGGASAQRIDDPVNDPRIDYVAPERKAVSAALPDPMPAIPAERALKAFEVSATSRNRFGIDPASLQIRSHRIVQYTLVITSPAGVRNIGYEALDCSKGQAALLAIGRDGEGWTAVTKPTWRPVGAGDTVNAHRLVLARLWCQGAGTSDGTPGGLLQRFDITPQHYRY
ncbi:MAG: CNP1-like family protein [Burkholderiaceae bacterium]